MVGSTPTQATATPPIDRACRHCGAQALQPLTKRQREVLAFVQTYFEEQGYAPTFQEIATHIGVHSLATVHEHLENLTKLGYILRAGSNQQRAITVL